MEHIATPSWAALAYLASGVLFILALRGLSSPASSRAGNRFGMVGMTIAVLTTLLLKAPVPNGGFLPQPTPDDLVTLAQIVAAIALGGGIGWVIARKIAMTDMPQLVAAFHSLVGMAAVLVGWAAYLNPEAFGIAGVSGLIEPQSRVEMGLGIAIGAITFSGSVIAFLKLAG
ncbi:MAG: NAD(P)(+) transhydrogenase (Re/Si-specific) subunit beta, partial [Proteobacteria bacterium]|nr:NAD(P)(+) transhydrogenase (Re/Si-specific) subunit beta [Pseudomonadota bacterium]